MTQTHARGTALLVTSFLLAALLLAFALILSGPRLAQAQDGTTTEAVFAINQCFTEYTGDDATDFGSADHTAVQLAVDAAAPGTTIKVAGSCAGVSTRDSNDQTVYISKSLTLEGGYDESDWAAGSNPGLAPTTLDAENTGRVVYVAALADNVILRSLILTDGLTSNMGGGIYNAGGLTLNGSTVAGSETDEGGGGVFNLDGPLTVLNSVIRDNISGDDGGGGIHGSGDGTILVDNSTITGNTDEYFGGGIYSEAPLTVTNGTIISDNVVGTNFGAGGGIYATGSVAIIDSHILSNTAKSTIDSFGGGISVSDGPMRLNRTTIGRNTAHSGGGLNATNGAPVLVADSTIISNTATDGSGGGIYGDDLAEVTIQGSRIEGNESSQNGGGLSVEAGVALTVSLSAVISNTAQVGSGGGIYNESRSVISGSDILSNTASVGNGGGIHNNGQTVHVSNTLVKGNRAGSGGGLNSNGGMLTVTQTTIQDNTARDNFGGGVRIIQNAAATIQSSQIEGNKAWQSGGGVWVWGGSRLILSHSAVVSNTAQTERGGGVYLKQASKATIENSTISGNRAEGLKGVSNDRGNGGGIYLGSVPELPNVISVTHSTIVNNYAAGEGGGMDFNRGAPGDVLTFRGTILAGNSAGGAYQNCYDYSTNNYTFNSDAHNLFSGAAGDDCPVGASDLSLQALGLAIGDVLVLDLAGNGGDTLNHALQLGSAAQDAVPAASCTLPDDQRSIDRPQGDDCDIGAYELDYYPLTVATAGAGSGTVTGDLGDINCQPGGADCSASYADGTQVTLTATPADGSTFARWSGACTGTAACTVIMDQGREITATFGLAGSSVYLPYVTK